MPNIEQVRQVVAKLRESLAVIDEQRAAMIEAIQNGERLLDAMEKARTKS